MEEMVSGDMLAVITVKVIILLLDGKERCVAISIEHQGNFMPLSTLFRKIIIIFFTHINETDTAIFMFCIKYCPSYSSGWDGKSIGICVFRPYACFKHSCILGLIAFLCSRWSRYCILSGTR